MRLIESGYCILPEPKERPKRKLTRNERLQAAADAGFDTWDDYNGER